MPSPDNQQKEYEGEIVHQMEMPEAAKGPDTPESLAEQAKILAQLRDPSSELGSLFAGTKDMRPTSND